MELKSIDIENASKDALAAAETLAACAVTGDLKGTVTFATKAKDKDGNQVDGDDIVVTISASLGAKKKGLVEAVLGSN